MKQLSFATAIALTITSGSASAALLLGGGSVPAVPSAPPLDPGRATIADTGPTPFIAASFKGVVREWVYQEDSISNPLLGRTFVYEVSNDSASLSAIERLTGFNYGAFTTDVSFDPPVGFTQSPSTFTRSGTGAVVGSNFNLGFELDPGEGSRLLIVRTDAPAHQPGIISIINGGAVEVPGYAPVPEPGSVGLLCLSGVALLLRRSSRKEVIDS